MKLKLLLLVALVSAVAQAQIRTPVYGFPLWDPAGAQLKPGSLTDTSTANTGINSISLIANKWLSHWFTTGDSLRNVANLKVTNNATVGASLLVGGTSTDLSGTPGLVSINNQIVSVSATTNASLLAINHSGAITASRTGSGTLNPIMFNVGGGERMRIGTDGRVLIGGTSTDLTGLQVFSIGTGNGFVAIDNTVSGAYGQFNMGGGSLKIYSGHSGSGITKAIQFGIDFTAAMTINTDRTISINTTVDNGKYLNVNGTAQVAGAFKLGWTSTDGAGPSQAGGSLIFGGTTNTNAITVNAPDVTTSYTVTLPVAQGASGTVMQNNGSGVLSWVTPSGGGGSAGGMTEGASKVYNTNAGEKLHWRLGAADTTGTKLVNIYGTAQIDSLLTVLNIDLSAASGKIRATSTNTLTLATKTGSLFFDSNDDATPEMTFTTAGKMRIGQAGTPDSMLTIANGLHVLWGALIDAKLSVTGTATFGKASTSTASLILNNASNANTLTLNSGVTSSSYALTLPTSTGNDSTQLYKINGVLSFVGGTNGQVMIGTGTGFKAAALTAGSGITITNSSGGISIATSGSASAGGWDQLTTKVATTNPGDKVHIRAAAGDTTGSYLLQVYGTMNVTGAFTAASSATLGTASVAPGVLNLYSSNSFGAAITPASGYAATRVITLADLDGIAALTNAHQAYTNVGYILQPDSIIVGAAASRPVGNPQPIKIYAEVTSATQQLMTLYATGASVGAQMMLRSASSSAISIIDGGASQLAVIKWRDAGTSKYQEGKGTDNSYTIYDVVNDNNAFFIDGANGFGANSAGTIFLSESRRRDIVLGPPSAELATTDTYGFVFIPTVNGTPTGTPNAWTGNAAMVIDRLSGKLFIYFPSGGWKAVQLN